MGGQGWPGTQAALCQVTAKGRQIGAVVCVHAKGMKEPSRALRVLPPEDRFAMVPGRKRPGGFGGNAGQPLRPPLDD